mgnify:CR=1 FL=1
MAQVIDTYETVSLLQGGADAFVQGTISTGIVPADGLVWQLRLIEMSFFQSNLSALSADAYVHWSISRDTKAAICDLDDADSIFIDGFHTSLTTSGQIFIPSMYQNRPIEGTIVVEPIIYVQLDSNAIGSALDATMRVHYDLVKLTEIEILRLINNQ